jgi:hypothetical protein
MIAPHLVHSQKNKQESFGSVSIVAWWQCGQVIWDSKIRLLRVTSQLLIFS